MENQLQETLYYIGKINTADVLLKLQLRGGTPFPSALCIFWWESICRKSYAQRWRKNTFRHLRKKKKSWGKL